MNRIAPIVFHLLRAAPDEAASVNLRRATFDRCHPIKNPKKKRNTTELDRIWSRANHLIVRGGAGYSTANLPDRFVEQK